jgi:putative SOS response-associated peptidase YedK
MCGRYTLTNKAAVKKKFDVEFNENFNVCPSTDVVVLTNEIRKIKWGYSPHWAKAPMNLINARFETIYEKPSFKDSKRCVFIMDGWYEWKRYFDWKRRQNVKEPYYHHLNSELIYVGGLYNDTGCVCVTKEAVKPISDIHNRQPVLLEENQIQKWLNGDHVMRDSISKNVLIHKVSSHVNSTKNNDYKCVQPI